MEGALHFEDCLEGVDDDSFILQCRKRRTLDILSLPHVRQNAPEDLLDPGSTFEARYMDHTSISLPAYGDLH